MERSSTRKRYTARKSMTPEQQALAVRYIPMARKLAKPLKECWPSAWDDLESAALMALVESAISFDPKRNVRFSTFARYRIQGALKDVQRQFPLPGYRALTSQKVPVSVPLTFKSEPCGRVLNCEPDLAVEDVMEREEEVQAMLRKLPPRHRAACRAIYFDGLTQSQAAKKVGCSQSRLSAIHKEALAMLNGSWYQSLASEPKTRN